MRKTIFSILAFITKNCPNHNTTMDLIMIISHRITALIWSDLIMGAARGQKVVTKFEERLLPNTAGRKELQSDLYYPRYFGVLSFGLKNRG